MKKSHALRHRKLAARRREAPSNRTPRTARPRQVDIYRGLDWGGPIAPPAFGMPAFGGSRYMALPYSMLPSGRMMMGARA